MTARTSVVWPFAGRNRVFDAAALSAIEAIERDCDAGMGQILARLESGMFKHQDIRAPILHGLVGGGTPDAEATILVMTHVDGAPIASGGPRSHLALAVAIMTAYAYGVTEAVKNHDGAGSETPPAPERDDTAT